jgi:hypothetical protein
MGYQDFTKKLVAAGLANVINATTANTKTIAQQVPPQQMSKVVVDTQAICSDITSSTGTTCDFTIIIHK